MELLEKSDKEIKDIAQPIWDNLVKSSNIKDYGGFTRDFSSQMIEVVDFINLQNLCITKLNETEL